MNLALCSLRNGLGREHYHGRIHRRRGRGGRDDILQNCHTRDLKGFIRRQNRWIHRLTGTHSRNWWTWQRGTHLTLIIHEMSFLTTLLIYYGHFVNRISFTSSLSIIFIIIRLEIYKFEESCRVREFQTWWVQSLINQRLNKYTQIRTWHYLTLRKLYIPDTEYKENQIVYGAGGSDTNLTNNQIINSLFR